MINGKAQSVCNRLIVLSREINNAANTGIDFAERIRELYHFCSSNLITNSIIQEFPDETFNPSVDRYEREQAFDSGDPYGLRWNAITQMSNTGNVETFWHFTGETKRSYGFSKIHSIFIEPIVSYLVHKIEVNSNILFLLIRYKLLTEWFRAELLFSLYQSAYERNGETVLDTNLREFLFESGIDYPFSQPASPHGKADVVANLETNDPLVLEVKVWDSSKNYKANRIRDGFRQIADYADRFGKDVGYLAVFNADERPLTFINSNIDTSWPHQIELNGKRFFILDIQMNMSPIPVSQREKGKKVEYQTIDLTDIINRLE